MEKKLLLIVAIIIIIALGGVYFIRGLESQGTEPITENKSREIARRFVENSPTYQFDGDNLQYKETLYPEITGYPNLYTFVFEFKSKNGGYGDRTEQPVIPVITPHEAHVTVDNGKVVKAVLDQKWDMIEQEPLGADENIKFESYIFEHWGDQPVIENGIVLETNNIRRKNFITLINSENETDRFNYSLIDEESKEFIGDTDFGKSVLVVIQEIPASSVPDYRVGNIHYSNSNLYLFINDHSKFGTDDLTIETVFVRVNRVMVEKVFAVTEDGNFLSYPQLKREINKVESVNLGRTYLEGVLSREIPGPWVGKVLETVGETRTPNNYWYHLITQANENNSQGKEVSCWAVRFEQAKRPEHWFEVWINQKTGNIIGGTHCR